MVEINKDCIMCGVCISICPMCALSKSKRKQIVCNVHQCVNCGMCVHACPFLAIKQKKN